MKSVVRLTPPQTIKLKGRISGREIIVLIDCGASHNFVSTELVQKLGLPRIETLGYGVIMGTSLAMQGWECVGDAIMPSKCAGGKRFPSVGYWELRCDHGNEVAIDFRSNGS